MREHTAGPNFASTSQNYFSACTYIQCSICRKIGTTTVNFQGAWGFKVRNIKKNSYARTKVFFHCSILYTSCENAMCKYKLSYEHEQQYALVNSKAKTRLLATA